MRRYELLKSLIPLFSDALIVCNIGVPSQELYGIKDSDNHFYMLGSMGLCSSIGLGLALCTDKTVIAIEGDGAVLMNLGTLATIGNNAPENFILLIADNGSYGSTGDQPTYTSRRTSLYDLALGAGCRKVIQCDGPQTYEALKQSMNKKSHAVIISRIAPGNEPLGIIPLSPIWIRDRFRSIAGE